jgi:hypothetical protein
MKLLPIADWHLAERKHLLSPQEIEGIANGTRELAIGGQKSAID